MEASSLLLRIISKSQSSHLASLALLIAQLKMIALHSMRQETPTIAAESTTILFHQPHQRCNACHQLSMPNQYRLEIAPRPIMFRPLITHTAHQTCRDAIRTPIATTRETTTAALTSPQASQAQSSSLLPAHQLQTIPKIWPSILSITPSLAMDSLARMDQAAPSTLVMAQISAALTSPSLNGDISLPTNSVSSTVPTIPTSISKVPPTISSAQLVNSSKHQLDLQHW